MIKLDMQQGTPEWLLIRAGIPTASRLDDVVQPVKLLPSKSIIKYVYELIAEQYQGGPLESETSQFMERGKDLEQEALEEYNLITPEKVETVGFCLSDDMKYGCSPDALVGENGGLEIKCPGMVKHIKYSSDGVLPSDYLLQVQGSMLVTGREWWDFLSWHPTMENLLIRVKRDEEVISALRDCLDMLDRRLIEEVKKFEKKNDCNIGIDKTEIIAKYRHK